MNRDIARKWLKQALHDLEMAEKNIEIEGYDIAAFLAHQAVEKLLKAIFALEDKKIPRIHYIDELAQELKVADEVLTRIFELTADYTLARYPDVSEDVPYEQYDEAIAKEKVESAKRIFELLQKRYEILAEENNGK
ncbi:HEPN domain-containing protein [candidate division WOR-3 bacterium]|nr:HEPN domain-containing protein [candidate division WOR-3 bacterium]